MAETNIPPALQLKELLASYDKLNDESPSSWFVWSDNPNIKPLSWLNKVCHADMRYVPKGYDYLVTAVPKTDKVSLRYLRMLIHGPFKGVSDLISLVRVKGDYYLQCSDLKKWPSAVLFNFCMASRVPIEFQEQLAGWVDLLDEGYPEVLSFLLSHSVGGKKFKDYRSYPEHGHHWFDPASDWRRIIEGKPDLSGLSYGMYPTSVTPSNAIWGKTQDYAVVQKLDNIKAAEYFGFKHQPKREVRRFQDKVKPLYWDMEAAPQPAAGANPNALAQAMAHLNQMQMQAAVPHGNPQWVVVNPAAVPQPVAPPLEIDVDDDDPDYAHWPDFQDDADD